MEASDIRSSPYVSLFSKTKRIILAMQYLSLAKSHEEIRDIVKHAARELVGSDGVTFVLREVDHCYYVDEDAIAPLWKGKKFPMSTCISGWVMLNKEPAIIPDIFVDSRIPADLYRPTFVKSLVMIPIRKIDPIGAIGNYWQTNHQPTQEEIALLEALADSAAIALENVTVYNELETRVQQRTIDLNLANKELEAFSYSVSHDLRAPLRIINGLTKLLVNKYQTNLNADARELFDQVVQNAVKMNELIEALLVLSRITKTEIEHVDVDLTAICKNSLNDYRKAHPDKQIVCTVEEGLKVVGDKKLLTILCENLLSNACKFTSRIECPIIKVEKETHDHKTILKISDNGVGFDMTTAAHIFEPFKRLHHDHEFPGTGIGLAIVKRIVLRHNAEIRVKSELNHGATFFIEFPKE